MEQHLDPTYAIIRYFVMLGRRTTPNPIATLPPLCMGHYLLNYLPRFPYNLYHYLDGCNFFQKVLLSGEQTGLQVDFIFNDSIEAPSFSVALSNGLNVFLICTNDDNELMEMNISLSRVCPKNCVFWVDKSKKDKFLMPQVITNLDEFWAYLFEYAQCLMQSFDAPLAVPLCAGSVQLPYFRPANVNFFTLSAALGNWGFGSNPPYETELKKLCEKSQEALSDMQSYARQEKMVDLIGQLFGWYQEALKIASTKKLGFNDQIYPPLIIAAPFTTKDVRDIFKKIAGSNVSMKAVDKVVELEQTLNYCYDINVEELGIEKQNIDTYIHLFHASRSKYLDFVASLHCSFHFSAYLRLPLICKSINTELSYVGAKNNKRLAYSKDRQAYDKAIHKIGEMLGSKLLAPKTVEMLETMPTQIVAMTDLPIEWMEVKGVPLGFSHDICRIPETPASGLLMHFGVSRFAPFYKIPKDILNKTLVVYGCREDAFKEWQDKADITVQKVGARSVVCRSLDEFENNVKTYKPDFLIVDTHGETDLTTHQSYILMGKERVYPKDIAARGISARLVFLSACNTAPCYNDVNTIANAMIEVGASAVTSSYLPLEVADSTILYIRILHLLDMAAKQNIHRNWLSFISHVLRTSFIMAPIVENVKGKESDTVNPMLIGKVNSLSMIFENRHLIYRKLKKREKVAGVEYDFSKVIPHYLMYTTIGRADLVEFEVAAEARRKVYESICDRM